MFDKMRRCLDRIEQIENRLYPRRANPGAFDGVLDQARKAPTPPANPTGAALASQPGGVPTVWSLARQSPALDPSVFGKARAGALDVQPLAQSNGSSCGQASVAMAVNALTGKQLRDTDIDSRYGFELLGALNAESNGAGYRWKDGGEISASAWELIDHKLNQEKTPVIVALNGPEFSPSGRGHIVTLVKTEGDQVTYADPATGQLRTTTKQAMNHAPSHPDGNFVFYAVREAPEGNAVANR